MPSTQTNGSEAPPSRMELRARLREGPAQRAADFLRENPWLWAAIFLAVVFGIYAQRYQVQPPPDLPVGAVTTRDIRAPFDLQIVDAVATEQKRDEARAKVNPVYDWDSGRPAAGTARVREAFATARAESVEFREKVRSGELQGHGRSEEEERLLGRISEAFGGSLSRFTIKHLLAEGLSEGLQEAVASVLVEVQKRKIVPTGERFQESPVIRIRDIRRTGFEWDQKDPLAADVVTLQQARRLVGSLVEQEPGVPPTLRGAVEELVRSQLQPSLTYSSNETNLRRERAGAQVEPLVIFLRKGQVLLKAGEKVDAAALQKITAYRESKKGVVNLPLLGALLAFLLLLMAFTFMYLKTYRKENCPDLSLFVLTLSLATVFVALSHVLGLLVKLLAEGGKSALLDRPAFFLFVAPVAAGSMLMTLLVNRHIAVVYTLLFAVLFGVLADFSFGMLLYALLSSCAGIYAGAKLRQRTAQWKGAVLIGAVNVPLALGVLLTDTWWTDHPARDVGLPLSLAFLSGLPLTVMLVSALLPPFESFFRILTDVRLLELSSLNHPLLKQLAFEAPGTYNHSLMMAALSEAAANAIGANGLFCRVACYYHDIGKLLNVPYFVENQAPPQNPHDRLAPRMSSLIVAAHIKDGLGLGRQHGLPEAVLDIIPQHHGTRRIGYFFDKALTMLDPEKDTINEADFRYPGPKPQTREAAIIMMADGIEAGSRVLKEPTHHRLKALVQEIVRRVQEEGQLEESDLTFRDLAVLQEAFLKTLMGVFSRRISYPGYSFDKEKTDGTPRSPASQPTPKTSAP